MTDHDDLRAAVEALADEWDERAFTCWRAAAGFSANHAAVGAADMASRDAQRLRDLLAEHPAPEPTSGDEITAHELARTIWHTSRADESTISATGANIVAAAILAPYVVRRKP